MEDMTIVDRVLWSVVSKAFSEETPEFVCNLQRLNKINPDGIGWPVTEDPVSPMGKGIVPMGVSTVTR